MDILGLIALARSKGSGSGSGTFVPSFGTLATIQTGVSWFGDDPYTLTVLVSGYTVTSNTMISVLPSVDVIEQMMADGVSNIFITNNNGVLTATAVGGAPTAAMTLQVLCTESDASAELGNLPNIVGDGVLETLQATDLTDAINQLSSDLDDVKNDIEQKQDTPQTAGTAGQVLSLDSNLDPVWVDQTGGTTGLTILSYGHSTWADFLAAYNANRVVYCRTSSSTNPGSGSQNRLAFLAFVQGTVDRPTGAEFQYYRSVSSHTAEQQGDQVYVYTLSNKGVWDVTTREASTKIAAGTNLSQAYNNGTLTLSFDGTGYITAPATAGTAGQVLGLGSNLNPTWIDQTGGSGMNIVNLSGTQITQVGADNTFYVCGELTELTFTAPAVGITMIRFTSGTTPTVLTVNGVTSWMYDNDPTTASLEANKTYDINVLNGVGVVGWA